MDFTNPFYQQAIQNSPFNNVTQFMQNLMKFRQSFQGDPKEMVMKMMQQNPQRYQQAVQMAQQLQNMMPTFGAQNGSIN